jgi:hypothetical protein
MSSPQTLQYTTIYLAPGLPPITIPLPIPIIEGISTAPTGTQGPPGPPGPSGGANLANSGTAPTLISTTSPTNLFSYTPSGNQSMVAYAYVVVQNNTTSVTLSLTWTDVVTNSVQTLNIINGQSLAPGVYTVTPTFINASGGNAVTMSVTVSLANNVSVLGSLDTA